MATAKAAPATASTSPARLVVDELSTDALDPNPWNPNRMDEETRAKLAAYLRREGLVQPLVVRPHPDAEGRYQILGGEHRWRVCTEDFGWPTVPCVVVDLDDRRAKVLTVNLNELSGEAVPHLMAELVHDLSRDTTLADLATQLPYTQRQLADLDELLKVPSGLELELDQAAKQHAESSGTLVSFMLDEPAPVEAALERAMVGLQGKNRRGRALTLICERVLEVLPQVPVLEDAVQDSGDPAAPPAASA